MAPITKILVPVDGSEAALAAYRLALEAARASPPDLILMDIAMPVMDGLNALAELRKDKALRSIPVFALTASAMTGDRESLLAQGFDGYVSKPIDHEVLLAAVGEALQP